MMMIAFQSSGELRDQYKQKNNFMKLFQKTVICLSLLTGLAAVAQTPAWPNKPVKIVNNFPGWRPL